jgi:methyl-accepting chemotaxis protein
VLLFGAAVLTLGATVAFGLLGMAAQAEPFRSICQWAMVGMALLCAGLGAGAGWALLNVLNRSLRQVIQDLTALAASDRAYRIVPSKAQEFWALSRMVRAVQAKTAYERHVQAETKRALEEARSSAVRAMTETVERECLTAVQHVAAQTDETVRNADDAVGAAARVTEAADRVNAAAQSSLMHAQTVGAAAEELSASVREISAQMVRASSSARSAQDKSTSVRERIHSLSELSESIGAVASLIGEIAGKTGIM